MDEKESIKKLKYLKYTNNPTLVNTPKVVSNEDFLELFVLCIALPKKKIIIVATNNMGIIFQSAYP
jgi:hypothetical protein